MPYGAASVPWVTKPASWFGSVGRSGNWSSALSRARMYAFGPKPTLCASVAESLRNVTVVPACTSSLAGRSRNRLTSPLPSTAAGPFRTVLAGSFAVSSPAAVFQPLAWIRSARCSTASGVGMVAPLGLTTTVPFMPGWSRQL